LVRYIASSVEASRSVTEVTPGIPLAELALAPIRRLVPSGAVIPVASDSTRRSAKPV
jgi:hypothetical protein